MYYNIEEIKDQFKRVLEWSQNIKDPKVDQLFDDWHEAKKDFIKRFDGRLIVELPHKVSFSLSQQKKNERIDEFIEVVSNRYGNMDLVNFINATRDDFFNNVLSQDYGTVKKGSKIIKAFKHFESDKEALENIQNHASRLIQEDVIEGYLCFSVHPLDFLSASENTHNWRSCHALDGEYRSGNLTYMVDKCTVMCYLRSDNLETLPNFPATVPWNSKKWRTWLFFSEDQAMVFAGRQYPFALPTAMDYVLQIGFPYAKLTLHNEVWSCWHSEKVDKVPFPHDSDFSLSPLLYEKYIAIGNRLTPMTKVIIDNNGSQHYNDLLYSSSYDPIYAYKFFKSSLMWSAATGATQHEVTQIKLGGRVKCLCCGVNNIELSESMMCIACEGEYGDSESDDFGYCSCCDRHMYLGDAHWIGDSPICESCYQTETDTCDKCKDICFKSDLTYDREQKKNLCYHCRRSPFNGEISF